MLLQAYNSLCSAQVNTLNLKYITPGENTYIFNLFRPKLLTHLLKLLVIDFFNFLVCWNVPADKYRDLTTIYQVQIPYNIQIHHQRCQLSRKSVSHTDFSDFQISIG